MKTFLTILALAFALFVPVTQAGTNGVMTCSVNVQYTLNNVVKYQYARDFNVSAQTPYIEDLSTATRLGAFWSSLVYEQGIPVITVFFDRDVSTFNYVNFDTTMKMLNPSAGQKQVGGNTFIATVPSATGGSSQKHSTEYELTCRKV